MVPRKAAPPEVDRPTQLIWTGPNQLKLSLLVGGAGKTTLFGGFLHVFLLWQQKNTKGNRLHHWVPCKAPPGQELWMKLHVVVSGKALEYLFQLVKKNGEGEDKSDSMWRKLLVVDKS